MSDEVIFDSPLATMRYHPESKILHHKNPKYTRGEDFRDLMMTGALTLAEKGQRNGFQMINL